MGGLGLREIIALSASCRPLSKLGWGTNLSRLCSEGKVQKGDERKKPVLWALSDQPSRAKARGVFGVRNARSLAASRSLPPCRACVERAEKPQWCVRVRHAQRNPGRHPPAAPTLSLEGRRAPRRPMHGLPHHVAVCKRTRRDKST